MLDFEPVPSHQAQAFAKLGSGTSAGNGHKRHKNTKRAERFKKSFCDFMFAGKMTCPATNFAKGSISIYSTWIHRIISRHGCLPWWTSFPPSLPLADPSQAFSNPLVALRRPSCAFVDNSFFFCFRQALRGGQAPFDLVALFTKDIAEIDTMLKASIESLSTDHYPLFTWPRLLRLNAFRSLCYG